MNIPKIAVVGLGYVGLNLASEMIRSGFHVVGIDSNLEQISRIENLQVPHDIIENGAVQEMFSQGFKVSANMKLITNSTHVFICVPTPLGIHGEPDVSAIQSASALISEYLSTGTTVVLESTSFPGTTEDIVVRTLEGKGMKSEIDFFVVFSSERVDPGNKVQNIRNTPKVVAARSQRGMENALMVYSKIVEEVVPTFMVREAEMSKLIENTYRLINIAFINELARVASLLQIDLVEALRLSATKPFGYQAFWPGSGIGGHCIPVDPVFLQYFMSQNEVSLNSKILDTAIESNKANVLNIIERVLAELETHNPYIQGEPLIALGMTYKANSSDLRESPSLEIIKGLQKKGVNIRVYDPLVDVGNMSSIRIKDSEELFELLSKGSLALLLQPHDSMNIHHIREASRLILDTTHQLYGSNIKKI